MAAKVSWLARCVRLSVLEAGSCLTNLNCAGRGPGDNGAQGARRLLLGGIGRILWQRRRHGRCLASALLVDGLYE